MAIQYQAKLKHVKEVSLHGTADLAYWRDRLAKEGIYPAERDGRALQLISSVDARFFGLRFRELSFSVFVTREKGSPRLDGAILIHAFNSIRFFAWVERTLFHTPYYPGAIQVQPQLPASILLGTTEKPLFQAVMGKVNFLKERKVLRSDHELWEVPIFLPSIGSSDKDAGKSDSGKMFFARLSGLTSVYPFLPEEDIIALRSLPEAPAFQMLLDTNFRAHEWHIRLDAQHAKGKTISRPSGDPWGTIELIIGTEQ